MQEGPLAGDDHEALGQKLRAVRGSFARRVRRLALSLGGALLIVGVAGCVTQTLSEPQGPQWQPGTVSAGSPAKKPAANPAGNKAAGGSAAAAVDQNAAANPAGSSASPAPPAAPANPTPAAEKPGEPPLGQLQLLSPSVEDWQTDRAPSPVERKSVDPAPARQPLATPPRVRQFYAYAASYAAGRCRFASCAKAGWNTPHAEGDSESRCLANSCLSQGWTTTHPDGSTTQTHCRAGSCANDGWSTTDSAAAPASAPTQTRCLPTGCFTAGWNTAYANGTTAETRCHAQSCLQAGWSTRLPSGDRIECRCSMNDCARNGAECT